MTRIFLRTPLFVGLLLAILVLFLLSAWGVVREADEQVRQETMLQLNTELDLRTSLLDRELDAAFHHVAFLHATPPVQGIVRAVENDGLDPVENTDYQLWVQRLQVIFHAYIENNPHIVQLRYISGDDHGLELVRVERSNGKVEVVPPNLLQAKSHREYFRAAASLTPGQMYMSNINLNREHGVVEYPPWPTYRVLKSVFDRNDRFFGFIIINFDAGPLLDQLSRDLQGGTRLFLLNDHGDYLVHPEEGRAFAAEFGKPGSWREEFGSPAEPGEGLGLATHVSDGHQLLYRTVTIGNGIEQPRPRMQMIMSMDRTQIESRSSARQFSSLAAMLVSFAIVLLVLLLYWRYAKKSEAELSAREAFQAVIRGSGDAIVSMDRTGQVQLANPACQTLFGVAPGKLIHANLFQQFFEPPERQRALAFFDGVIDDGHAVNFESAVAVDDQRRDVAVAFSVMRDAHNWIVGVAAIISDITESKLLANRLSELNDKLSAKNVELERFIYTVSHDLKSPLVTIGGFSQRVLDSTEPALDEKNRHRLGRVVANVEEMRGLLDDLLQLSRIANQGLQQEEVFFHHCVDDTLALLEQRLSAPDVQLQVTGELNILRVNRRLLVQCLQNLVDNAVNYRDPDQPLNIEIRGELVGTEARISVRDNGPGIDPRYHQQIFRIFERLDRGEGSGVGLAIVKAVAEKHGGRVELESTPGEGSCFTLYFPQHEKVKDEPVVYSVG